MTTLLRRQISIIIFTTTYALALLLAFSTPVINGVTVAALLILGAGTYGANRVQRIVSVKSATFEAPLTEDLNDHERHSTAA